MAASASGSRVTASFSRHTNGLRELCNRVTSTSSARNSVVSFRSPQQIGTRNFTSSTPVRPNTAFEKSGLNPEKSILPWRIPFSQTLSSLPQPLYANPPKKDPFVAEISTLSNGLKVASESKFGEFCTIGVVMDAGSRYEVAYPSGICHFLEKLAFNSTLRYDARDDLYAELERHGGICDAQSTKDTFVYAASCHISGLDQVLGLIAEAVLRPQITEDEFNMAREVVAFEVEDMSRKPDCDAILTDLIHAAAFRENTLGLPKYCPPENVPNITKEMLFSYMKTHFAPQRMVVAGVGVPHDALVDFSKKHFEDTPAIWDSNPQLLLKEIPTLDHSISQYTGGEVRVEKDLSIFAYGPSPFPNLAHLVLGLESCSYKDPDFVAFCVLNSLMGGGGSFSAGGPGKGMYTRLYLDVLNEFHWMYSATAYNHVYADSGIFCMHASAPPEHLGDCAQILVKQFLRMAEVCGAEELNRAKTQLQSMLMMNLEQRPVMFEDLGRQVLGHGLRTSPLEYVERIKAVEASDIKRISERMLNSKVSVVGYGDLATLPSYEAIDRAIANRDHTEVEAKKKFSIFYR